MLKLYSCGYEYCLARVVFWPKKEYFSEKIGSFTGNLAGSVCYTTDRANQLTFNRNCLEI